jgi:hypothetical protein
MLGKTHSIFLDIHSSIFPWEKASAPPREYYKKHSPMSVYYVREMSGCASIHVRLFVVGLGSNITKNTHPCLYIMQGK